MAWGLFNAKSMLQTKESLRISVLRLELSEWEIGNKQNYIWEKTLAKELLEYSVQKTLVLTVFYMSACAKPSALFRGWVHLSNL